MNLKFVFFKNQKKNPRATPGPSASKYNYLYTGLTTKNNTIENTEHSLFSTNSIIIWFVEELIFHFGSVLNQLTASKI